MAEEPRPPYVRFEVRPIEDRDASIAAGHFVSQDVIFAIVTPAGTRERLEKVATEWLAGIEDGVKNERFPEAWLHAYRQSFENFKQSRENPDNGTPITNWPALSPSQVNMLLDMNIRTIEDVAVMTEEAIQRLGMGARAIREKAVAWLENSKSGIPAERLAALEQENAALKDRNETLEARLEKLERMMKTEEKTHADANSSAADEEESIHEEVED